MKMITFRLKNEKIPSLVMNKYFGDEIAAKLGVIYDPGIVVSNIDIFEVKFN